MWDRFRAGAGAGAGAGGSVSASVAAAPWSSDPHDNSRRHYQQPPPPSPSQPQWSSSVSAANYNSWQPRSSAIAQRQRQQRSVSGDSYAGAAAGAGAGYGGHGGYGGYGGYQYSIKGGPPPQRPLREFEVPPPVQPPVRQQTFPQQPSGPRSSHQRHDPRESTGRPTSSVYSQPSFSYSQHSSLNTNLANQRDRVNLHRQHTSASDDVSPPSSPELPAYGNLPNHDISPIDEEDDFSLPHSRPNMSALSDLPSQQQRAASRQGDTPSPNARSNIPTMRRERRQQRDADAAGRLREAPGQQKLRGTPQRDQSLQPMGSKESLRQPSPVPLSLKPAGSRERLRQPSPVPHNLKAVDSKEALRQPTVDYSQKPGSSNGTPRGAKADFAHGLGISTWTAERRGTSPVPPRSPSMAPIQHPTSDTDPAAMAFTSNRPGWRGASGRTAIVEPLKDNPTVAPLRLPPRSNKRAPSRSSDGPNPSLGGGGGGGGSGGRRDGNGGTDLAMPSPPISPETRLKEQEQQQQQQGQRQQIGGSTGAGRRGGVASSMANTFRKFIPSSQRQPSSGQTAGTPSGNVTPQGYPSPPLSSSPTLKLATANVDANASTIDVNADGTPRQLPLQQHTSSAEPSPTASQPPIRRKRVGSGTPSAHLNLGHQPKESFASSVYSQQTEANPDRQQRPSQEAPTRPIINTQTLPGAGGTDSPYVQPPSRFSVTTYATSAYTSTPRESLEQFDRNRYNEADAPPLPTPPIDVTNNNNNNKPLGDSVMDRSRPKLRSKTTWDDDDEPVKISLSKPWMSMAGANSAGINVQSSPPRSRRDSPRAPRELLDADDKVLRTVADSTDTPRDPSIGPVDKALPAAPPEVSASSVNDRVAMINAQLQSLGNRRININRSIKQMTELMPRDNLMAAPEVMRKRELEKLKVQELERELADVQREEHELGMKLHRAYKRLDRHAEYEPTTLWVRRATG